MIELIFDAYKEEKYYNNNGMSTHPKCTFMYLADTRYVVRPSGRNRSGRINDQNIQRRVRLLSREFGNPFLTITNIWLSGMVEYAKQYMKEKGISALSMNDYKAICKRYGQSEELWYSAKTNIDPYL